MLQCERILTCSRGPALSNSPIISSSVRVATLWRGMPQEELDDLFDKGTPALFTTSHLSLALATKPVAGKLSDLF